MSIATIGGGARVDDRDMPGQHMGSAFFSVALHVALLAALTLTFRWPSSFRVAAVPAPIQGVLVDQSVLRAEQDRRDQEVQRKQREERQKKEAAEQQQREKEAADKRERDRIAEQQRVKEQAEREKAEAAKAAQEKAAKEKAAQEAREKQAKEDAARKQKEAALAAKQKAQLDAETQREAAQEAARMEAERNGVMDEYIRQIQDKIARNWNQPLSVKPGLECVIRVVQLPTGDVFDAKVDPGHCNADDAVKRSIEDAVRRASPLPKPPSQAAFDRNLIVTFRPDIQQ